MGSLKEDIRSYQRGDKKALDTPKKGEKPEEKTPAVNADSLRRLVKRLSPKLRDELLDIIHEQKLEDDLAQADDESEDEDDE